MNFKTIIRLFIAITLLSSIVSANLMAQNEIKQPKNIIVFISDGWGEACIEATNYYQYGKNGENIYENFPVKTWMSTYLGRYNTGKLGDFNSGYNSYKAWSDFDYVSTGYSNVTNDPNYPVVTGSAAAATTMSTGEKTYWRSIGMQMLADPTKKVTSNDDTEQLVHVAQNAQALGKSTGVVTSVQFAHATPAGFIAHNYDRGNYSDIAKEMIYGSKLDVIMGCGNPEWSDNGTPANNSTTYVGGSTTWAALKAGNTDYTLITSKEEFNAMTTGTTPNKVIGIPETSSTLQQSRSGASDVPFAAPLNPRSTTLEVMTKAAINVLDNNPNGFFVMVEGGAVDWAGHANQTGRIIEEQMDYNKAVEAACKWVEENSSWDETLIIVTGDHETGYITGPNNRDNNPNTNPVINNGKGNVPGVKWNSGGHTNMLIPFYAKGAGAEIFDTYSDEFDMVRGRFMDNTSMGIGLKKLFPLPNQVTKAPKNIIFMISDGWGKNTIDAANAFEGKTQAYEQFPLSIAMSNYLGKFNKGQASDWDTEYNPYGTWTNFKYIDHNPTGSAAAASSMAGGRKSYYRAIGLDANGEMMKSLCEKYRDMGAASGVITSVQLCHATPAAFVSHVTDRGAYTTITDQIVYNGHFDLIMGCGNPEWTDNHTPSTPKYSYIRQSTWNDLKNGNTDYTLVTSASDIQALTRGTTPNRLLACPEVATTLQQTRSGNGKAGAYEVALTQNVPTLATMTSAGLNVLDNNPNGFFLMIEGGAVDWAGHANQLGRIIEEQSDFNRSVDSVIAWVERNSNWDETLLIVTGDHETGHLTGPNANDNNPFTNPVIDNGAGNMPSAEFHSGEHTNQLIPLYAKGAGINLLEMLASHIDPVWGHYVSNTEMATTVNQLGDMRYKMKVNSKYMTDICQNTPFEIPTTTDINGEEVNGFVTGGSGDYSYKWSPASRFVDNTEQKPVVKGLISTTQLNCEVKDNVTGETAHGNVLVQVGNKPEVSVTRTALMTAGLETDLDDLILNYDSELTYIWETYFGQPLVSNVTVTKGMSRYYVYAVDKNGCVSNKTRVIIYGRSQKDAFTAEEISVGENSTCLLVAYPTPVQTNMTIEVSFERSSNFSIEILDLNGAKVQEISNLNGQNIATQIDCSQLAAGTYFIVLHSDDDTVIKQFIKL